MNEYVCADCGREFATMERPCPHCKSVRVVLLSIIEAACPNWRENFTPNPDPVTVDHPEYKAAEATGRTVR